MEDCFQTQPAVQQAAEAAAQSWITIFIYYFVVLPIFFLQHREGKRQFSKVYNSTLLQWNVIWETEKQGKKDFYGKSPSPVLFLVSLQMSAENTNRIKA